MDEKSRLFFKYYNYSGKVVERYPITGYSIIEYADYTQQTGDAGQ